MDIEGITCVIYAAVWIPVVAPRVRLSMHNEEKFPRKAREESREKAADARNLFPFLVPRSERDASILILTRHLAHVPPFTGYRVPPRIALCTCTDHYETSRHTATASAEPGYVCRVSSEWRSLANRRITKY